MQIIDYSLIESDDPGEFVQAIREAIEPQKGWQPLGGACVWFEPWGDGPHGSPAITHYVQALVKYGH